MEQFVYILLFSTNYFYIIISRFASDFIRFIVTSMVELLILEQEKLNYAISHTHTHMFVY